MKAKAKGEVMRRDSMKRIIVVAAITMAAFFVHGATEAQTANAIARTLWAEARSEGEFGIRMVASVIYNRAGGEASRMYRVVTKPKQFSCWNAGEPRVEVRTPGDIQAWDICVGVAWDLVRGRFIPITEATHFEKAGGKVPRWATRMRLVRTYGRHNFYKE